MTYYPVFLDLTDRKVLLVGGGSVARRKLASLLQAKAKVRLVAPEIIKEILELLNNQVDLRKRDFEAQDIEGVCLAIAATDHKPTNALVAELAQKKGIFVNVVDQPESCSFIVPAMVKRGDLALAISTFGASPAVAKVLRKKLQESYGPEWVPYLQLMKKIRKRVISQGEKAENNSLLFVRLAESKLLEKIASRDVKAVESLLLKILGPGYTLRELDFDPELILNSIAL